MQSEMNVEGPDALPINNPSGGVRIDDTPGADDRQNWTEPVAQNGLPDQNWATPRRSSNPDESVVDGGRADVTVAAKRRLATVQTLQ